MTSAHARRADLGTRQGHQRSRPPRGRAYSDDRVVDAAIRRNRSGRPAGTATQPDPAPLVNFSSALATRWVPTSEEIANKRGDRNVARRLNRVRKDVGAVRESELPIRRYDAKSVPVVVTGIDRLRDPSQVRTVLAYEESNRNRKGVVEAAKARIEVLASSLVAAS